MAGRHGSAERLIHRGRLAFVAVSERTRDRPSRHRLPPVPGAASRRATTARLAPMIQAVCRALGSSGDRSTLTSSWAWTAQVDLVEMGARPGWNGTPRLVLQAFGVKIAQVSIQTALGEPFEVRSGWRRAAALYLLHAERDGERPRCTAPGPWPACPSWSITSSTRPLGQTVLAYTKAANKLATAAGRRRPWPGRRALPATNGPCPDRPHPRRRPRGGGLQRPQAPPRSPCWPGGAGRGGVSCGSSCPTSGRSGRSGSCW